MKILKLFAENVMRLKVVEVTPTGAIVLVGGPNDAGKSSILNAICMALGGAGQTPHQPVREGAKSAKVRLELGESIEIGPELIVKLTMTASGGRALVVENRNGLTHKSPQAILDKLYQALAFNPMEFERMPEKQQAEMLRALVGLDTSDLDQQRQALYEERTLLNRDAKTQQVMVERLSHYPAAPAKEVSIAALVGQLEAAERAREAARTAEGKAERARATGAQLSEQVKVLSDIVAALETKLAEANVALIAARAAVSQHAEDFALAVADAKETIAQLPDTVNLRQQLSEAEQINAQVRVNLERATATQILERLKANAEAVTRRIERIDREKTARIAAAQFPVPGLGIDDRGVTFGGLAFSQASSSTRTLVSMSIAIAQHPKLRVALVRDGSLLGSEKLDLIAKIAAETDSQVWVEMMQESPTDRTTVYIEDGTVVPLVRSGEVANA